MIRGGRKRRCGAGRTSRAVSRQHRRLEAESWTPLADLARVELRAALLPVAHRLGELPAWPETEEERRRLERAWGPCESSGEA